MSWDPKGKLEEQQMVCLARAQDSPCWVGLHTLSGSRGGGGGEPESVFPLRGYEEVGLGGGWAGEKKGLERHHAIGRGTTSGMSWQLLCKSSGLWCDCHFLESVSQLRFFFFFFHTIEKQNSSLGFRFINCQKNFHLLIFKPLRRKTTELVFAASNTRNHTVWC